MTHVLAILHVLCRLLFNPALCWQLNMATAATTHQEKLLGERELAVERQKQEIESLNRNLVQKQEEVRHHFVALHAMYHVVGALL